MVVRSMNLISLLFPKKMILLDRGFGSVVVNSKSTAEIRMQNEHSIDCA